MWTRCLLATTLLLATSTGCRPVVLEAGATALVKEHPAVSGGYVVPVEKAAFFVVSPDRMAKLVKAAKGGGQ